jgi:hypothetical protein
MPLDTTRNFGPDDVVVEELDESIQEAAKEIIKSWLPNRGKWRPRPWIMDQGGYGRTKEIELERPTKDGRPPRLVTMKTPGGQVIVSTDSYYRMALIDLIMSVSPAASPPKTIPRRKRLPRQPTAAELGALARGRETMRQRRKQDREEASAASRSES